MTDMENQDPIAASLNYVLPPLTESIRRGRISTFTTSACVTALFAVLEVAFLIVTNSRDDVRGSIPIQRFFVIVSYAAIVLNVSASISSLYLVDALGALAFRQVVDISHPLPRTGRRLLKTFGANGFIYSGAEWHWFISFNLGVLCVFGQLLTYIWLYETKLIAIVITAATAYGILPFLAMLL